MRERDRDRDRERERMQEHTGSLASKGFICFLKVGVLGEDLSRVLNIISFPGMSFQGHGLL